MRLDDLQWADGSPVTEEQILSLAGKLQALRRKSQGGGRKPKLNQAEQADVRRWHRAGKSYVELAEEFGVSARTIRRYCK